MKIAVIVTLGVVLAGCVSGASQRDEAVNLAVARWRSCVTYSYASNRNQNVEKNLAAENAFAACKTEDDAIAAHFATNPNLYLNALRIIAAKKADVKAQLMSSG